MRLQMRKREEKKKGGTKISLCERIGKEGNDGDRVDVTDRGTNNNRKQFPSTVRSLRKTDRSVKKKSCQKISFLYKTLMFLLSSLIVSARSQSFFYFQNKIDDIKNILCIDPTPLTLPSHASHSSHPRYLLFIIISFFFNGMHHLPLPSIAIHCQLNCFNKSIILPIRGIDSDVSGIFSAMASMKTEKASRTVMPSAIFSPDSGGRQNTSSVRTDIMTQGRTTLTM